MDRDAIKMILAVLVTCVVAASGLAATYAVTSPRIAAQEAAAEKAALASVLPGAMTFEAADAELVESARQAAGETSVAAVYRAADDAGEFTGWGIKLASRGYAGPISLVLGLDRDGKVLGLTILTMNETPGLGTRIKTEPAFLGQFRALPAGFTEKDVRKLDMISGATKSSRGVRASVEASARIFEQALSGSEGEKQ
jgi:electron transport complex protein RnfG